MPVCIAWDFFQLLWIVMYHWNLSQRTLHFTRPERSNFYHSIETRWAKHYLLSQVWRQRSRSSLAPVFAILWMTEGAVLTILFSARLTSDLTAGEISTDLNRIGKKVFNNYSSSPSMGSESIAHEAEGRMGYSKIQLVSQKKYRDKTSFAS